MEEFKVKSSSVRQASQLLDTYQGFLSDRSSQIDTIRRQLRGKISQHEAIGSRLKTISDTVDDLQDTMRIMSHCLERVDFYYQQAENRIIGQSIPLIDFLKNLLTGTEQKHASSIFGKDGTVSRRVSFMDGEWHHDRVLGGIIGGGSGAVATGNQTIKFGDYEGSITGKSLSGEYSYDANAQANKDNIEAYINGSAQGSAYQADVEQSIFDDHVKNSAEISMFTGAVAARAGAHLMHNGSTRYFGAYASAEASGSVLHGSDRIQVGTVFVGAEGDVLAAEASAAAGFGYLGTDSDGAEVYGVQAQAGAEAYLAQGTVHSGLSLFGIEVDVGLTGKVGGAGASAGGGVTNQGIDLKAGLGLGFGGELELSVDWTNASWPSWLPRL